MPISVVKLQTVQGYIRPDVMTTCPKALESLRRFQPSFADTDLEDSLHLSGRQGNTVWMSRSLKMKLCAYILHPFGRQGHTIQTLSLLWLPGSDFSLN
jgi:hypothetical protein